MLNTSNITQNTQPINLYKKEKSFSLLGDWLAARKEIKAKGYKAYYAFIQRTCGERGYCYLKNETIAEKLGSHPKTIQNYHNLSRQYNLIKILPTGRSSIFILNYHHWMGISADQATTLKPQLPAYILCLIDKYYPSEEQSFPFNTSQPTENKEFNGTVETVIENHVEDLRSMHAEEVSQASNTTDREIREEKETININVSTTTSANVDATKVDPKEATQGKQQQSTKSIYTLEVMIRFILAYAMMKLGTNDEIKCHQAFATHCLKTGEKDPWIAEFIANNYVLTPINPLKDHQVTQPQEQPKPVQATKQAYKKKYKPVEPKEVKGKYPHQVYLDFVNYEIKQGKTIYSIDGLTNHLHITGSQDSQVGCFVELMKNTYAGGKPPQSHNVDSNVNPISATTSNNDSSSASGSLSSPVQSPSPSIEKVPTKPWETLSETEKEELLRKIEEDREAIRRVTAIESLSTNAWSTLTNNEKELLLNKTQSYLLETKPAIYSQMPTYALTSQIKGLVKQQTGEMLYKSNTNNLPKLLQAIGKQIFDGLEDYEQSELQEAKIEEINHFYKSSVAVQSAMLEEICDEIYFELGIDGLAKRISQLKE